MSGSMRRGMHPSAHVVCLVFSCEAVRKWKFRPYLKDGVPVAFHYAVGIAVTRK
jgi:hypothetical protein